MKLNNHGFTDIPTMMVIVIFVAVIFITFIYLSKQFNNFYRTGAITVELTNHAQNNGQVYLVGKLEHQPYKVESFQVNNKIIDINSEIGITRDLLLSYVDQNVEIIGIMITKTIGSTDPNCFMDQIGCARKVLVVLPSKITLKGGKDKCNVGKDLVPATELVNYNCEAMAGCEWRRRGGKTMSYFACCPKNVTELPDKFGTYNRCFVLVD